MRIFITGASGFIGNHIVPMLIKDQHEILILTRETKPQNSDAKNQIIVGDLKNLSRFKDTIIRFNPEICLHLAWEGIPDFSYEQSKRNFDHSMNLIEMLASQTACRKILVSGSSWEYGRVEGACHEEDRTVATSYFTWAKNAIHTLGSLLCVERKIDFIWLRIFFSFGPGQRENALIPTLYNAFKNGRVPDIKNPFNEQDFIDVRDVAEAFRAAVNQSIPSGAYNIGQGKSVSVSDICSMVEIEITKKPLELRCQSPEGTDVPVRFWANTSKFQLATAWRPQISIQEGIKNHIEFLETR